MVFVNTGMDKDEKSSLKLDLWLRTARGLSSHVWPWGQVLTAEAWNKRARGDPRMAEKLVMRIDKPHFVVKLHEDTLEVDLKRGIKKELEDAVEAHPILRESLGVLFQTIVPLDVALKDIQTAEVDKKGHVKLVLPLRRDITIPLEAKESKTLAKKLNELIPQAKLQEAEHTKELEKLEERPRLRPREPF